MSFGLGAYRRQGKIKSLLIAGRYQKFLYFAEKAREALAQFAAPQAADLAARLERVTNPGFYTNPEIGDLAKQLHAAIQGATENGEDLASKLFAVLVKTYPIELDAS